MARCPQCTRYFCRECVTEHDGRFMCRACLAAATAAREGARRDWSKVVWPALAAAGFLFAWFAAYLLGDLLSRLPNEWHGGPSS